MTEYKRRRDPKSTLLKALLGTVGAALLGAIIIGGAALIVTQVPRVAEGWQSRGWPTAPATVTTSDAVQRAWKPRLNTQTNYGTHVVVLRYAFDVDGRRYEGTRRSLDAEGKVITETSARRVIDALPVGARVSAHYDPANPARSLLEPGVPISPIIATVFGGLLIGAGGLAAIAIVRGLRSGRR